mmetsp:Transcript_34674/g.45852  ORF Transcript_34674/g.45852 Transcript_34674/m.45852 type:complete len:99 (+) Transcript_34674:148-444(+)
MFTISPKVLIVMQMLNEISILLVWNVYAPSCLGVGITISKHRYVLLRAQISSKGMHVSQNCKHMNRTQGEGEGALPLITSQPSANSKSSPICARTALR